MVTGASRGIGAALARELGRRGAAGLVLAARDAKRLAGVACELRGMKTQVEEVAGDVAWPETAGRIAAAAEALGGLDLVVNNAAVVNEPADLATIPDEEWRRIFETNVLGAVRVARATLPLLARARPGCLLNISSYWGRAGAARFAPYCASKFAIEGLSQSLAEELPETIVCAVNPGVVATDMLATAFGGDVSGYTSPEECARGFADLIESLELADSGRPQTVE